MKPTKKYNEIRERRPISEKIGDWGDYDLEWWVLMVWGIYLSGTTALMDIHKPRGKLRGVNQLTILLHEAYLVKVTTKGEGVKNFDHVVYE